MKNIRLLTASILLWNLPALAEIPLFEKEFLEGSPDLSIQDFHPGKILLCEETYASGRKTHPYQARFKLENGVLRPEDSVEEMKNIEVLGMFTTPALSKESMSTGRMRTAFYMYA